jgi:hypothetical protein
VEALTSKDADFCGDRNAVRLAAKLLEGELTEPDHGEVVTPSIGILTFVDDAGEKQWIDFIDQPYGLEKAEVEKRAQELVLLDSQGADTEQRFLVMHPLHCLQSRVANTANLPGYKTPLALRQLRAAVICSREYALHDVLGVEAFEAKKRERAVLNQNEALLTLALSQDGLAIFGEYGIDVFDAILDDPRLPEVFRRKRPPQMRQAVADKRRRRGLVAGR